MRNYQDYDQYFIGESEIASLIVLGGNKHGELETKLLYFGKAGIYKAYVISDESVEIGSQYEKKLTFYHWMQIIDDKGLSYKMKADVFHIYRAGEFDCIIHAIGQGM